MYVRTVVHSTLLYIRKADQRRREASLFLLQRIFCARTRILLVYIVVACFWLHWTTQLARVRA